jgi:hypothetical protein
MCLCYTHITFCKQNKLAPALLSFLLVAWTATQLENSEPTIDTRSIDR